MYSNMMRYKIEQGEYAGKKAYWAMYKKWWWLWWKEIPGSTSTDIQVTIDKIQEHEQLHSY